MSSTNEEQEEIEAQARRNAQIQAGKMDAKPRRKRSKPVVSVESKPARSKAIPCDLSDLPAPMSVSEKQIRDGKRMNQWTAKELQERLTEIDREVKSAAQEQGYCWSVAIKARRIAERFWERFNEIGGRIRRLQDEASVVKREIGLRQTMPTIQERDT